MIIFIHRETLNRKKWEVFCRLFRAATTLLFTFLMVIFLGSGEHCLTKARKEISWSLMNVYAGSWHIGKINLPLKSLNCHGDAQNLYAWMLNYFSNTVLAFLWVVCTSGRGLSYSGEHYFIALYGRQS